MLFRNLTPTQDWLSSLNASESTVELIRHPVLDADGSVVGHVAEALTEDTGILRYLIVTLTGAGGREVMVPIVLATIDAKGIRVRTLTRAQLSELEPYAPNELERSPGAADTSQPFSEAEIQAARALLLPPRRPGKARGLNPPVNVGGPPIEDVLRGHRGPDG